LPVPFYPDVGCAGACPDCSGCERALLSLHKIGLLEGRTMHGTAGGFRGRLPPACHADSDLRTMRACTSFQIAAESEGGKTAADMSARGRPPGAGSGFEYALDATEDLFHLSEFLSAGVHACGRVSLGPKFMEVIKGRWKVDLRQEVRHRARSAVFQAEARRRRERHLCPEPRLRRRVPEAVSGVTALCRQRPYRWAISGFCQERFPLFSRWISSERYKSSSPFEIVF